MPAKRGQEFWTYWQCSSCELIFADAFHHLGSEAEKERYLSHNNDPADKRYKKFLYRLWEPLRSSLRQNAVGLNFGSGPSQAMRIWLGEEGFELKEYDPFFANEPSLLLREYDFVLATEVVEHLHDPYKAWRTIKNCLGKKAPLGIMTMRYDKKEFADWPYRKDPTHVCFYSQKTVEWLGEFLGREPKLIDESAVIFESR